MQDPEGVIARARALSEALKDFHRALIRAEAGDDPVLNNPYTMLFALIDNPAYAWMGGLSRMIARLDEEIVEGTIAQAGAFEQVRLEAAALIGEGGMARPTPHFACAISRRSRGSRKWGSPPVGCARRSGIRTTEHYSPHTASSFPAGSTKWKRRPPGKAKIGLTIRPPASSTAF